DRIVGLSVDGPNTLDVPADRELRNVYVEPEITSRGIGQALAERALQEMRREGTRSVALGVFPSNLRAIAFYERLGFVRHRVSTWTNNGVEFADQIMLCEL
ncbi:GNAT family N-acetyltransferase, partial [bacterium]